MRAGRINRRVNIQAQTKTIDDSPSWGDANSETWATVKTVHAGIEPLRGAELYQANQFRQQATVRVVIRYHAYRSLTAAHRLTYDRDGTTFILNIEQAILARTDRGGHWECMCVEGIDKG